MIAIDDEARRAHAHGWPPADDASPLPPRRATIFQPSRFQARRRFTMPSHHSINGRTP